MGCVTYVSAAIPDLQGYRGLVRVRVRCKAGQNVAGTGANCPGDWVNNKERGVRTPAPPSTSAMTLAAPDHPLEGLVGGE